MPLYLAAWENSMKVNQVLLEHNADIEARNEHNLTPLYIASKDNRTEVTQLHIQNNAYIEANC